MSLAVDARVPPIPPPKPKNYTLHYPNSHQSLNNPKYPLVRASSGVQFVVAPADSDTDSGICADSDNQLSPRRSTNFVQQPTINSINNSSSTSSTSKEKNQLKIRQQGTEPIPTRDYLSPNTTR
ncbi:unnamed protein product [Anisakis simplex]|uniref:Uncharacterized protein n=1 Tax=Anisakis simplex TaxID=6269 RepID=A0A0M3K4P9_ANISI|nr:unnamed protein product [Anisakis simplex]